MTRIPANEFGFRMHIKYQISNDMFEHSSHSSALHHGVGTFTVHSDDYFTVHYNIGILYNEIHNNFHSQSPPHCGRFCPFAEWFDWHCLTQHFPFSYDELTAEQCHTIFKLSFRYSDDIAFDDNERIVHFEHTKTNK